MGSFILLPIAVFAQTEKQLPQELLDNIFSQIAENKEQETVDETLLYETLLHFAENPIKLNNTNKEELEKLQFLTDEQIENLLYYLYMYFPMETIYELKLVDGFYGQDIRNLLPFVQVGKADDKNEKLNWRNIAKYGKHEIIFRIDKGLETKEGYKPQTEEVLAENPNKEYLGDPFYSSLKYRFRYKNRIYAGITAEKDAGEEFWGAHNKGFDFYSAHIQINGIGHFKTIVLGDYGASFGQGLLMNTQFGFGKSAMVLSVDNRNEGLHKYSSSNEFSFFRGAGTTLKFSKMELTAFYSSKNIDGDTLGSSFSSIKEDGLHRTLADLEKKQSVNLQVIGTRAMLKLNKLKLGLSAVHLELDHALSPTPYPYNLYYFKGKTQSAGSVDYKFRWRKFYCFGETALTEKQAWASLNGLSVNPVSAISLLVLHRYYAKDYELLYANAFGESSRNNNEEGLYIGAELRPFRSWKIAAYADSYRFPWLKYGIDQPSDGYDYLLQADFYPQHDVSMYWRFRFEQKQDNMANDTCSTPDIRHYDRGSLRYVLQYTISENLKLRNTLEATYSQKGQEKQNWGFLLGQDLSLNFPQQKLGMDLRYEFFDAMNYENRFYTYEKDVLYAFSVPMLYGKGCRYYLNLKYAPMHNLSLYFKIGQTVYSNKETVGTDLEEIQGNRKTDMRLVVKYHFDCAK